ncbi:lysosomal Pro-X carboxypeptidase-like isoform X2 [Argiope bruennichi]|uniref:lysosomal Pro-X carboxypeptidase-like isoform X2 n=1 Tax=Argiope bruennichi TaxID=94029 RepID=UPI00249594D2|nr:lysosomal Pro-X carboxypeptidase-like isoform X2 [Argiope bruennichi]
MLKFFILLCSTLFLRCTCNLLEYEELYFTQQVDHFGFTTNKTYEQRYLANYKYYNPVNGSIFFYTGNEGVIDVFVNNTGFMEEIAPEFSAAVIFAEHRYYGKSLPFGNHSFDNNTVKGYLSSQQALADFANLIYYLKNKLPGGNKAPVVAFGGSYGGMLAAWIRIKYPHLVNGALASSAPILLFTNEASCYNYPAIITKDFMKSGISCAKNIRRSWEVIRKIGKSDSGAKFLSETFKTCQLIRPSNISLFVDWVSSTWESLAMTDYPYPTNFLNPLPGNPINVSCQFLLDESVDDETLVINIYKAASVFLNYTGNTKCNDVFQTTGPSIDSGLWDYQTCTELVEPVCSSGTTDMFEPRPWNFTEFSENCWKQFQVRPIPNVASVMYGGTNIISSSNIIFTNGKLDPWSGSGILQSLSDTLIAIVMDGAAHHLELRSSNPADPESVKNARIVIRRWIHKWTSKI